MSVGTAHEGGFIMPTTVQCLDDPATILAQSMCLSPISKNLIRGSLKVTQSNVHQCKVPACTTLKTVHAVHLPVSVNAPCDSNLSKALDGAIDIKILVTAFDQDGNHRGFHAGDFVWTGAGVTVTGRISGLTNEGTHRKPVFADCQPCDAKGVMEGRLCGQVTTTQVAALKGCQVEAAYRLRFDQGAGGGTGAINGTLEGVIICQCGP
jgi:hypothetical protein